MLINYNDKWAFNPDHVIDAEEWYERSGDGIKNDPYVIVRFDVAHDGEICEEKLTGTTLTRFLQLVKKETKKKNQ